MQPICRHVIDQDHESMYPLDVDGLFVEAASLNAVNLKMKTHDGDSALLGTFDDSWNAGIEVENILKCEDNFYIVNGYSNGGFAAW